MSNSTGISISMRTIEEQLGKRRFAQLDNAKLQIDGHSITLTPDLQLSILKQGIYRAIYLPLYSEHRAKQARELKAEHETAIAQADSKLAVVRKVLASRGMTEQQIDAAFEKAQREEEAKAQEA